MSGGTEIDLPPERGKTWWPWEKRGAERTGPYSRSVSHCECCVSKYCLRSPDDFSIP